MGALDIGIRRGLLVGDAIAHDGMDDTEPLSGDCPRCPVVPHAPGRALVAASLSSLASPLWSETAAAGRWHELGRPAGSMGRSPAPPSAAAIPRLPTRRRRSPTKRRLASSSPRSARHSPAPGRPSWPRGGGAPRRRAPPVPAHGGWPGRRARRAPAAPAPCRARRGCTRLCGPSGRLGAGTSRGGTRRRATR